MIFSIPDKQMPNQVSYYMLYKKRIFRVFIVLFVLLFIAGACAALHQLDEKAEAADEIYETGNPAEALAAYEEVIASYEEQEEKVPPRIYRRAGLLAYELGNTAKTLNYLGEIRRTPHAGAATHAALARSYREIDNLSLEITSLENYVENYPDGKEIDEMRAMLFETWVESKNFEKAYELWPELEQSYRQDEDMMAAYMQVNRELGYEESVTELAEEILEVYPDNVPALEWLARKHFREADKRYNREMAAYEENRTHRQYAQLLKALEIVNTDLHIALDYFKRLFEQEPLPEYASSIANIYERLQNEKKAEYYREKAGG